jgi:hypothetical protein
MYEMRVVVLSGLAFMWVIACLIPVFCGFNREFTRGTAKVRASWIRVALQQWLAHLIRVILGGSATAGIRAEQSILETTTEFSKQETLYIWLQIIKFAKMCWITKEEPRT